MVVRCFFRWGRGWKSGDQGSQDVFDSSQTGFDVRIVARSRGTTSALTRVRISYFLRTTLLTW